MPRNEGTADRVIRALIGIVLLAILFLTPITDPVLYWVMLIAGVMMLFTALTGFCLLYRLVGIKTCKDC